MPGWFITLLTSLTVGVILFILNRVTFKSSADVASDLKGIQADIAQLKRDSWTTEQRLELEKRLVLSDERLSRLIEEVDFTKTSHREFLRLLERAWIPVAHSPHTPELDALLEKRDRGEELTAKEWRELIVRLRAEAEEYQDAPGKKMALRGLLAIYLTHLRAAQKREGILA